MENSLGEPSSHGVYEQVRASGSATATPPEDRLSENSDPVHGVLSAEGTVVVASEDVVADASAAGDALDRDHEPAPGDPRSTPRVEGDPQFRTASLREPRTTVMPDWILLSASAAPGVAFPGSLPCRATGLTKPLRSSTRSGGGSLPEGGPAVPGEFVGYPMGGTDPKHEMSVP
ncbi:MAG: hypothetical protein L3K19_04435 [Thermoplasmata archaeon]|nr:hypothetical protein [Thermoplasmata archaeon]